MHGFYRVAAAVPVLKVADPAFNVNRLTQLMRRANDQQASLLVLPELAITGYTCADLFHQQQLLTAAEAGLQTLLESSKELATVVVVGAPLLHGSRLYNCACVLHRGELLGIVPKSFLPTYKEYYEKRWFTPGAEVRGETMEVLGRSVPFGVDLLFAHSEEWTLGIEICEDLWNVIPPSSAQALAGATLTANPSASVSLVAKHDYRRHLVSGQSGRCLSAYVYAGCGVHESTTDVVFGGHAMIAENGAILRENEPYQRDDELIYADVDLARLRYTRLHETSYGDNPVPPFRRISVGELPEPATLDRQVSPHPFVPGDPQRRDARCREIFQIQAAGLAKRLEHARARGAVIGISGGLDSTLALLVTVEAFKLLDWPLEEVMSVTMPGYGTSDRTYNNAVNLCRELGTSLREINIVAACDQHFSDIGHDPETHDVTYENVQARERTQILMDIANQVGGLVIGTGDLSEIALGWSTYNGDHMSMYAVNCSVPKTLIQYVIRWVADDAEEALQILLYDILDTPISPELLPKNTSEQFVQKTEDVLGPYELHDFFLYHHIKYGAPPAKIAFLAEHAFGERYPSQRVEQCLRVFLQRFFNNQFKRSCIPDGPKVGTIALSPRGDWRMPSDASSHAWLQPLDEG